MSDNLGQSKLIQQLLHDPALLGLTGKVSLLGIGSDLCAFTRFEKLLARRGDAIAKRILSPAEFELWLARHKATSFLAKRWAGKEAIVKALGTGFAQGIRWRDISILNTETGKPYVAFSGVTESLLTTEASQVRCFVSLSDDEGFALGFSVAYVVEGEV